MTEERGDGSFWDIGEPRRVLRRIENGLRSSDDLMSMIQERADVELRYAQSLRQWASKWEDALRKGLEYGSVLTAWRTVLQEASVVAKIHEDCRMRLTGDGGPYYNAYKWKNDHFHRVGQDRLREMDQAKEEFAAAQRDYAKLVSKLHRAKKAYHNASIAAYRARQFADDEASNPAVKPEARWKHRERADGLALERERLKQVYLRRVLVCNVTAKEKYIQSMTSVFDRWQGFERGRLDHIQSQLQLFVRNLNTHSGTGMRKVFQGILDQVRRAEPAVDVDEWGRKYGTGSKANWPKYEEIDPRRHQTDAETSYHQLATKQGTVFTTTDEMTDDFTTDDFDSEMESAHGHAHHQWPLQPGHAHQFADRPYRSQQYEIQPFDRQWYPQDHWGHEDHHRCPPEPHYSQNEDLSERWLEERLGRHSGRNHGRRWDQRKMHHDDVHHSHRHDSKHHASVQRHLPPQDHHNDPQGHFYKGQISKDRFQGHTDPHLEPHPVHHHTSERTPGYHQDQGTSSSWYDTIRASQSQESYIHANHPSSTVLEQHASSGDYHGDYEYHGNTESDDRSSPEEVYFKSQAQDQTSHARLASAHAVSQTSEQTPSKVHTQTDQQMPKQTSSQVPAHQTSAATHQEQVHIPAQTPPQTPTQTQEQTLARTPAETTAQTFIEKWKAGAGKAALLEQARQALQPKDGERLVRVLYDFKPATRDEMALKQSEYLVQIGGHLSNGWAYGRKADGRGHFPASYVQVQ